MSMICLYSHVSVIIIINISPWTKGQNCLWLIHSYKFCRSMSNMSMEFLWVSLGLFQKNKLVKRQ